MNPIHYAPPSLSLTTGQRLFDAATFFLLVVLVDWLWFLYPSALTFINYLRTKEPNVDIDTYQACMVSDEIEARYDKFVFEFGVAAQALWFLLLYLLIWHDPYPGGWRNVVYVAFSFVILIATKMVTGLTSLLLKDLRSPVTRSVVVLTARAYVPFVHLSHWLALKRRSHPTKGSTK